MIHYHGGPITPDTCAIKAWKSRHAFISFANNSQIGLASEITQSFAIDNGAFTLWKQGGVICWDRYYSFVNEWMNHPGFDFAVIPDVIGGSELENDKLITEWPHGDVVGVPVWHMNESDDRFIRLCKRFPRVAIGSCGDYDVKFTSRCIEKLHDVIRHVVDKNGYPITKLHGLRMLNQAVFSRVPLASADSTNVARNIGIDKAWKGAYSPQSKETRASIMVERIESINSSGSLKVDDIPKAFIQYALL